MTTLFTESISPKLTGGYSMVIRCAAFFGNCRVHHTAVDFVRANSAAVDFVRANSAAVDPARANSAVADIFVADSLLKQSNHG